VAELTKIRMSHVGVALGPDCAKLALHERFRFSSGGDSWQFARPAGGPLPVLREH
jgi:hypothetical protein